MKDLYEILGTEASATQEEIKSAFRRAAMRTHPDREGGSADEAAAVNHAYAVLGDEELRAIYDETGRTDGNAARKAMEGTAKDLLNQAIAQQARATGIAKLAKNLAKVRREQIKHGRLELLRVIDQVRKLQGTVTVTAGADNLVEGLLSEKLLTGEQELERLEKAEIVIEGAIRILDGYADVEQETSHQTAHKWQQLVSTATANYNALRP